MFTWRRPVVPLIVGHRGSPAHAPENTLASFRRAIADGARAIELDVQLTRDGELVVIHDTTLRRTTAGRGRVASMTLKQLRQLSAGKWFGREFVSERIPTLDEVLDLVGTSTGVNIELKGRKSREGADAVISVLRNRHLSDSILITSFRHSAVDHARQLNSSIPAGYLFSPIRASFRSVSTLLRKRRPDWIVLGSRRVSRRVVEEAHVNGAFVAEYTVNTARRLERSLHAGVDAIISDKPSLLSS